MIPTLKFNLLIHIVNNEGSPYYPNSALNVFFSDENWLK